MRDSVRRALALASLAPALTGALVATAPAAHATAPSCGPGSTVLVDFFLLGGLHTRVATYDVSATVKNVCVELAGLGEVVTVVRSGAGVTPPSVTQTPGTGRCAQPILDMTAPVTLSLSAGVSTTGPAICIGQNGATTTVSFNAASVQSTPDVDVWTRGGTTLGVLVNCMDEYATYVAGGSFTPYADCYWRDHQLV